MSHHLFSAAPPPPERTSTRTPPHSCAKHAAVWFLTRCPCVCVCVFIAARQGKFTRCVLQLDGEVLVAFDEAKLVQPLGPGGCAAAAAIPTATC